MIFSCAVRFPKNNFKIPDLSLPSCNATNNAPALVQKIAPAKKRSCRSWGGFWGAAFSLATEEQLNKALP
jgi:hypothetical protein